MEDECRRFALAVEKMRLLQKQYFKSRDRAVLIASKEHEKIVDTWITDLHHKEPELWTTT